jgi:hypothetical protein
MFSPERGFSFFQKPLKNEKLRRRKQTDARNARPLDVFEAEALARDVTGCLAHPRSGSARAVEAAFGLRIGIEGSMTLDVEERRAAIVRALVWLANECADHKSIRFGEQELSAATPLRTTLAELKDAGFVKQIAQHRSSASPFMLTLDGWYAAQEVSGRFTSTEFDLRRGRLCATLKKFVAGRRERSIVHIDHVVTESALPFDWVWNMLEARVLYGLDPRGRYDVRFENRNVWIEPTFGQEPADL